MASDRQPVKFQLVSRFLTGSKMKWFFFYRISELMLQKQSVSRLNPLFFSKVFNLVKLIMFKSVTSLSGKASIVKQWNSNKGSIFPRYRYIFFLSKKGFYKLICSINTIIKRCIWQTASKIPVSLSFFELDQKWNDFLSYIWINVANINSEIR